MYDKCIIINTALKIQIILSFDDPYLSTLKNAYTGYDTKSTMELITHLYNKYAWNSTKEMATNREIISTTYNMEEPLESLIESLNKCTDFSTAASKPV